MPAVFKNSFAKIEPSQEVNPIPLNELRLQDIFRMTPIALIKYLAYIGLLRDGSDDHQNRDFAIACQNCRGSPPMTLVQASDRTDGWKWRYPKCHKREKSIRDDSIFAGSKLDIVTPFAPRQPARRP